jgi:hypothetical protein
MPCCFGIDLAANVLGNSHKVTQKKQKLGDKPIVQEGELMQECGLTNEPVERRSEHRKQGCQYHSVEFSIDGLELPYIFKIWNIASMSMCVLVKEDSDILLRLKLGDTLNIKYYSVGSIDPPKYLETAIRHITKSEQGRFKGHYLVGLEILETQDKKKVY